MARVGNTSSGPQNNTKGPCTRCGSKEGPFQPVMASTATGRKRMIRLCPNCKVAI